MKSQYETWKYFLVIVGVLLLSGCGGGGGGDGTNTQNSNSAPVITGAAKSYVQATTDYRFVPNTTDANGDPLTYRIQNLPAWADFNAQTGELSGRPPATAIGQYQDIIISVSDGSSSTSLAPFSIQVLNPPLNRNNIVTGNAVVTTTENGYDATGDVSINSGGNNTPLKNARLQFEFDAGDNLTNVTGTALLPDTISDYLLIPNPLTVKIGMYTGRQINDDPNIGVQSTGGVRLLDDLRYIVFFLGAQLNITVQNKNNATQVPVTLGLGEAQSLIIMDPTDPFSYVFGYVNGLGFGTGFSGHSLIPYVPGFNASGTDTFAALDSFYGNEVDKGVFPIGIKIFDLLSLSGSRVVANPDLSNIDWTDPLNAKLHYSAGYNGQADFNFAILGIGLFSYHLADMAATIDVGAQRQHFAVQGVYAPIESSQPVWLPVRPSPVATDKLLARMFADGNGGFGVQLAGKYESDFPKASLKGVMNLDKTGMQLDGVIDDSNNPITISARASASVFDATVRYSVDINAGLRDKVLNDMDSLNSEIQSALNTYQNALSAYNLAVSLDGLRAQLPAIADTAISLLNQVPGDAYNSVYNSALTYINNGSYCISVLGVSKCYNYKDYVTATSVASTAASSARNQANTAIAPYITALNSMKQHAGEADDAVLRQQLKTALLDVYSRQTINKTVSYSYSKSIDYGVGSFTISKTFSYIINKTVIPSADAALIKTAADNVDKIPGAYTIMIDSKAIFDSLPVEQTVSQARLDLQNGLRAVPSFGGAGYRVASDYTQSAYILLNGQRHAVQFNLLDPVNAISDIIRAMTLSVVSG